MRCHVLIRVIYRIPICFLLNCFVTLFWCFVFWEECWHDNILQNIVQIQKQHRSRKFRSVLFSFQIPKQWKFLTRTLAATVALSSDLVLHLQYNDLYNYWTSDLQYTDLSTRNTQAVIAWSIVHLTHCTQK